MARRLTGPRRLTRRRACALACTLCAEVVQPDGSNWMPQEGGCMAALSLFAGDLRGDLQQLAFAFARKRRDKLAFLNPIAGVLGGGAGFGEGEAGAKSAVGVDVHSAG